MPDSEVVAQSVTTSAGPRVALRLAAVLIAPMLLASTCSDRDATIDETATHQDCIDAWRDSAGQADVDAAEGATSVEITPFSYWEIEYRRNVCSLDFYSANGERVYRVLAEGNRSDPTWRAFAMTLENPVVSQPAFREVDEGHASLIAETLTYEVSDGSIVEEAPQP